MDVLSRTLARDIMTKEVIRVYPKTGLKELSSIFIENEISGVPVVDDEINIVGFVSQTDLVELELHSGDFLDSRLEETGGFVQDIMVPDVACVCETEPVNRIIDRMCTERLHRLIVTNEQEKVSGILTTMDVMCFLRKAYKEASRES